MARRDSRIIRMSNEFIEILDKLNIEFNASHNINLSYYDISKTMAKRIIDSKFKIDVSEPEDRFGTDINIEFLEENIDIDKKMDAEHYATGYFKELGYKVYFTKKILSEEKRLRKNSKFRSNNDKLVEIISLYENYPKLKKCVYDNIGSPDLVLFKDKKMIFVEVKTGEDGLRPYQIKWMRNHNDVKTIIFYLNQNIIKNEKRN